MTEAIAPVVDRLNPHPPLMKKCYLGKMFSTQPVNYSTQLANFPTHIARTWDKAPEIVVDIKLLPQGEESDSP